MCKHVCTLVGSHGCARVGQRGHTKGCMDMYKCGYRREGFCALVNTPVHMFCKHSCMPVACLQGTA